MSKDAVVLVVDDERDHADGMAEALQTLAKAIAVYDGSDALEIIRSQDIDVVVTDLKLGGEVDGLAILQEARKLSRAEVILITAYATIDTCKEAIKQGAYDYLVKPINIDQLRSLVEQAARSVERSRRADTQMPVSSEDGFKFYGIRGNSPQMTSILEVLRRVAPTNISVLIQGESGTGKELLARAIHENSNRWNKRFVPINCAGFTETLLESELFGHVKGAFTGAAADRKGLFEIADKGTLFLDEIGDMPLNMQAKLLRVIEDGVVIPVGGNKPVVVDVRIISATNHDLPKLVEEKKFREDLYFRIKGVSISVPPLRQRREDIPALADFFLKEAAGQTGSKVAGINDTVMHILASYEWPGNIRQLRNVIRTMVVMCDRDTLGVGDLPPEIHQLRRLPGQTRASSDLSGLSLNEIEKQAIIDTLAKTGNNRQIAAKLLGIGERTLYRKIKEYDI